MRPAALARKGVSGLAVLIGAPAALLLAPGRAEAILTYNIFQDGSNVVVQASGSLGLPTSLENSFCGSSGLLISQAAQICTGPNAVTGVFGISGPLLFSGTAFLLAASNISGIATGLFGDQSKFIIDSAYVSNTSIASSATFNGQTLAGLGFITPGLIGSWQLNGVTGDAGLIELRVGAPADVPGPLPLFGAAAAFGWSRTLRRRIRSASTTTV